MSEQIMTNSGNNASNNPAELVDLGYVVYNLDKDRVIDGTKTYEKGYSGFVLIPWRHDGAFNVSTTNGTLKQLANMKCFGIFNCDPNKETSIRVWSGSWTNSMAIYGIKNN